MQTVTQSFTAAADGTPLIVGNAPALVTWAIAAGSYSGHVVTVERSKAGRTGGWEVVGGPYTTDDVAVSGSVQCDAGDLVRFNVENVLTGSDEVTGTIVTTLTEEDRIIQEIKDAAGKVVLRLNESGIEVPGTLDVTGASTLTGAVTASAGVNASSGVGAAAGTLVAAAESGNGVLQKTTITLSDEVLTVPDADAFAGTQVYDFPEGAILVLGVTANLSFAVTSARASTINLNAAMDWSLGSAVEATNTTLDGVQADFIAKQDLTLDQADAGEHADTAQNGTPFSLDGTGTAANLFINVAFPTTTDIDADGTIEIQGTITIHWINLGDY